MSALKSAQPIVSSLGTLSPAIQKLCTIHNPLCPDKGLEFFSNQTKPAPSPLSSSSVLDQLADNWNKFHLPELLSSLSEIVKEETG